MSLLDAVEEEFGAVVRGSKSAKSAKSPLSDLKDLKEPQPSRSKLQELAGPDWEEISTDPKKLNAFADLVMIGEVREKGICPDHYTSKTECKNCGPVPIWPGCPPKINGCPWCLNRLKRFPIPNIEDNEK